MENKKLKILACATDAGGAANVAPIYSSLDKDSQRCLIYSLTSRDIFRSYGLFLSILDTDLDDWALDDLFRDLAGLDHAFFVPLINKVAPLQCLEIHF